MASPASSDFVHLHVHSDYSLLDGACRIDRLMDRTVQLGMPALAITDHGNLFGAISFYNEAKKKGIKPLVGCEIYMVEGSRLEKTGRNEDGKSYYHMGLIARDLAGYQNLIKLVSDAHLKGFYYKPRTDIETLARHAGGLIGFTGCLAALIPQHLLHGREQAAREAAARFVDIFGRDNFLVEIQDHGLPEQRKIIPGLLRLAREFNLRTVCTNDVHYINARDAVPHDALLCIQTGAKIADQDRMRFGSPQFYLKTADEMAAAFGEIPEALSNTRLVADMCDLAIPFPKGSERYPRYPLPPEVSEDRPAYLKRLCVEGLLRRYDLDCAARTFGPSAAPAYRDNPGRAAELCERLDYELSIIARTGFVDYFLVVWDFIHWAKSRGIPVGPGRGSGAGSLVAYALGITNLDPLRFRLLFERFLNPERVSPPDFDIDFCMRRRGEVIDYVRGKYGASCVANIITYGTLGAKMVIRDLARVHGLPYAEGDRLAKMIPDEINIPLEDALRKSRELADDVARNPVTARIIEQSRVLEGLVRNTGKHAAGIIITDRPLDEFAPLTLQEGDVTVQYDMAAVYKLGLLKMDMLGLKTLTVISDAVANVRRTADPRFDIEAVPFDDPATYALLNSGRTVGVFQLESSGMQNACRTVGISSIDDINAICALYRPGPMQFIPDYTRGKKDPASVSYPHPLLEQTLRETYGIIVYQEQVMECARIIAGYTLGGADMLRRAMGKKDREAMEKERAKFIAGARDTHGIPEARANEIFDLLNKFAEYGFNKSHSAAYAVIGYQTAFLKANFPVQFMAALLTSELGNADKAAHFIDEALSMGIEVLGPDVNESRESFTPVVATPAAAGKAAPAGGGSIRFGLAGIKGVGESASQKILSEREERGPFRNFNDFILRVDSRALNKRVLECLILTGAFDFSGEDRAALHARLDASLAALADLQQAHPGMRRDAAPPRPEEDAGALLFDLGDIETAVPPPDVLHREFDQRLQMTDMSAATLQRPQAHAQDSLAGMAAHAVEENPAEADGAGAAGGGPLTSSALLRAEKELLGFYVSGHPMDAYRRLAEALSTHAEEEMAGLPDRAEFRLAGIASAIAKKISKKDNRPWAQFTLSTRSGSLNLHLYADAYEQFGRNLENERPVLALGTVLRGPDGIRLNCRELYPLDAALPSLVRKVTWLLHPAHPGVPEFLRDWRTHMDSRPGNTCCAFGLLFDDHAAAVGDASPSLSCRIDPAAFQGFRRRPCVAGVIVEAAPVRFRDDGRRFRRG